MHRRAAPPIPEAGVYPLSMQCLVPLSSSLVVYPPSLLHGQHRRGSKTTCGFNQACPCTRPTPPYDTSQDQARPHYATSCTSNADCGLARACCRPRRAADLGCLTAHVTCSSLPHGRACIRRITTRSFLPASLEGLTLGSAGAGRAGAALLPPGLCIRNLAYLRSTIPVRVKISVED